MSLRLCHTDRLQWIPDLRKAAGGSFAGHQSDIADSYVKLLLTITPNITVQSEGMFANIGQEEGNAGCLGSLQHNQSDLIASESLYPTMGHNLTNGPVSHADKTAFLSVYWNEFSVRHTDVMQSFCSFSTTVWFMIILSSIFIMLMISCSKALAKNHRTLIKNWEKQKRLSKRQNKDKRKILRTISAPAKMTIKTEKQDTLCWLVLLYYIVINRSTRRTNPSSLSAATLTLMLIFMSFNVASFFMAIVKTDKVTLTTTMPPTIESYDDIINSYPNKKVVFFEEFHSHLPFMKAKAGSKMGKIWQNAKHVGLNNSFSTSPRQDLQSFMRSEVIFVAPGRYIAAIASSYCKLRKQLDLTAIPMRRSDESAKQNIYVFVLSAHLLHATAARVMQVFGRLLPSGFSQYTLAEASRNQGTTHEDFDMCLSNVVWFPVQHLSRIVISLNDCNRLLMTIIILSVPSFVILLIELLFDRMTLCGSRDDVYFTSVRSVFTRRRLTPK